MFHKTLKTSPPPARRRGHARPLARRLWRYSDCGGTLAGAAASADTPRMSVCVLSAGIGQRGGGGGGGVMHTIHGLCRLCIGCRLPQVTIHRGKDGYGFTICSDSPVRVQGVDPGGPADQAGLQLADTLLQLNGLPVEQWKCIDLAHAIRNSANEIVVVVWRTGPSAKPSFEGLIHRPSFKPSSSSSNYDAPSPPTRKRTTDLSRTPPAVPPLPAHHQRTSARRLLVNGTEGGGGGGGGLGSPWGARVGSAEELDGMSRGPHPHTQTLKGTRVKASNGDNYIILAPINPGSQVLANGGQAQYLHPHHLLLPPPPPHHQQQGLVVAHPRYVSFPYHPDPAR